MNRGRRKPEGRDDAVTTFDPLDDGLFEQRLALTGSAMQHRISDRFFRAVHSFFAWRFEDGCGSAQLCELRVKLSQSTLKRVDSIAEPRLGLPAVLEGAVVALYSGLGSRDLGLQSLCFYSAN